MTLVVYNTLTRRKEVFQPFGGSESISADEAAGGEKPLVRMYVCGVTVYDLCHLGHARTYVVWDMVRRYLECRGYRVKYVQNFTDVDDKILKRALERGESMQAVAERFIAEYFQDMDRLNIKRADLYPRATRSLRAMFELIQSLELKGFAYRVRDPLAPQGETPAYDVYYAVRKFPDYGQLSGRKLEELEAGASGRVGEEGAGKRDPFDFALWKAAPPSEPGFESPWGWGRPGWHIECSAMVRETLGDHIDIHAGGADLIFPHHENELAQSEPITGKPLAKYWLHNGFVNVNGQKMSKSLGNFTTLRQALALYHPMALRLFLLQTHYRSPIDLTEAAMEAASHGWETLQKGIHCAQQFGQGGSPDSEAMRAFQTAMDDDFGTPGALALAFELAKELIREHNLLTHQGHTHLQPHLLRQKGAALLEILATLGFCWPQPAQGSEKAAANGELAKLPPLEDARIEELVAQRTAARKAKNFAEADRIREQLKALGITLIDQKDGTTRWLRQ
ncbi:cysteinyl-tRNA synthetase [Thermostichus sp. MS-CIW-21]|jgi:cysteinyl-tRNA synthetase|uniref:Cysteine--tRNA ligase n=3 Tax=unclassified Synechococcus TaxID=2626047 RepID=SYC_SYNJA|nr:MULTISPECIES: cysteine--tRNA ligase [unclassified Synechococcus]Q2JTF4.1 RecName: Full=Cysteine--tRNA ligase; AltName: Full=Cysteinyl-tRNA synthetase; Short=CysRS [Synechococcus sp. JA-3-3Ab]ABD00043.1 cysteinyl-tRNA synthetase [Synechococcus sp. JA-3-3Ab]PIK87051.1 cysteinyl-tRNA synthetase [Synechococcus sp. 63AY4M2]PIK87970.1 cysteinyl-tRNA synthetase [Synechococcus sp. 65AY6A5]PIK92411.1 cysteinyl-tRNA synthetase [Synechococcus sp. 65AY6Li]PIK96120.1 cysteinyl-tRNA synthetase [Synechoc